MHWNKKFSYVKYGQGFWLLKQLSYFMDKHDICLEESSSRNRQNTPLIICGDFNSKPSSGLIRLMYDQKVNFHN